MANNISFYYDPQRQGLDTTLWKTLSGAPYIGTNCIILSEAAIVHYADIYQARVIYDIIVPSAPVLGDSRVFGLAQLNNEDFIGFNITDDVFSAVCSNSSSSKSVVIAWKAIWTNVPVKFEIRWRGYEAKFFINGVKVATITSSIDPTDGAVPSTGHSDDGQTQRPMSLYASNINTDDLKVVSVNALDISQFI